MVDTHVMRILFDESSSKAVGVEIITQDGQKRTVMSNHEVIVSAGAYGSPHLLLLSGIGDRNHLEEKDVEVVKDLPGVGQHL